MNTHTLRIARTFVIAIILCFSHAANAKSSTAQGWFDKGSSLIKQNQIREGIAYLKRAANRGHGKAAFELGSLHETGLVVDQDFRLAKKYYEISVRQGFRDAHFNLALMLSSPMTPNNDLRRARDVASVIAEKGDIEAQYLLATLMKTRMQKVAPNPGKAFYWMQHAANSGHPKAQFALGAQYLKGEHVSKSTRSAMKWFKRAALQNVPEAHYNISLMYEKGEGVDASMLFAMDWLKTAAELGNPGAQQNLAIRYLTGDYLDEKPKIAVELLTDAARSGAENAQVLLGKLYHTGYKNSIAVDLTKAESWYRKAAQKGKSEAQYQLALILMDQEGRASDAQFWMDRAVASGHVEATKLQANL